jgi:hypothetical protein
MKRLLPAVMVISVLVLFNLWGLLSNSGPLVNYQEYSRLRSELKSKYLEIQTRMLELQSRSSGIDSDMDDVILRELVDIESALSGASSVVSINTISVINIDGNVVTFVKSVTNVDTETVVDSGYEFNISVTDIREFLTWVDNSPLLMFSLDVLESSQSVVLRVRSGV